MGVWFGCLYLALCVLIYPFLYVYCVCVCVCVACVCFFPPYWNTFMCSFQTFFIQKKDEGSGALRALGKYVWVWGGLLWVRGGLHSATEPQPEAPPSPFSPPPTPSICFGQITFLGHWGPLNGHRIAVALEYWALNYFPLTRLLGPSAHKFNNIKYRTINRLTPVKNSILSPKMARSKMHIEEKRGRLVKIKSIDLLTEVSIHGAKQGMLSSLALGQEVECEFMPQSLSAEGSSLGPKDSQGPVSLRSAFCVIAYHLWNAKVKCEPGFTKLWQPWLQCILLGGPGGQYISAILPCLEYLIT